MPICTSGEHRQILRSTFYSGNVPPSPKNRTQSEHGGDESAEKEEGKEARF
ncbi:MAG: hypothetical protein LBM65_04860 [Oscillospiraceae bacterium]|nr:hypothetical protein [Oscillospiraceae bacterium]